MGQIAVGQREMRQRDMQSKSFKDEIDESKSMWRKISLPYKYSKIKFTQG